MNKDYERSEGSTSGRSTVARRRQLRIVARTRGQFDKKKWVAICFSGGARPRRLRCVIARTLAHGRTNRVPDQCPEGASGGIWFESYGQISWASKQKTDGEWGLGISSGREKRREAGTFSTNEGAKRSGRSPLARYDGTLPDGIRRSAKRSSELCHRPVLLLLF